MKDAASIAAKFLPLSATTRAFDVYALRTRAARSIERYAARLVKAERERCCKIIKEERALSLHTNTTRTAPFVCDDLIEAINTPAKRPSKRKGKR